LLVASGEGTSERVIPNDGARGQHVSMGPTSRRGVIRPKLVWRVSFPLVGLLALAVAVDNGVGAWMFVVGGVAVGALRTSLVSLWTKAHSPNR
jgi:hypothetical protein